jgi:hypothetical protein
MDESVVKHLEQTTEMDAASRLMLLAADILQKYGHCKGTAIWKGAHCISGAVTQATFSEDCYDNEAHCAVMDRLQAKLPVNIIEWNDAPERTADEVISFLRSVALGG